MSRPLAPLPCVGLFVVTLLLTSVGCGPKPPATPPAPQKTVAEERRERWFGPAIAAKQSIQWRESGLGIEIIRQGTGAAPTRTDKVRVNYVGRLLNGKEFDSSYYRGKPNDFVVQQLITGWAAAMSSMKAGGKAIFYIPPHLGYGGLRAGDIPPNSSLIFEVELLEILPPG